MSSRSSANGIVSLVILIIAGPICLLVGLGIYYNHDIHMLRASSGEQGLCRVTYVGYIDIVCNGDNYSRKCRQTFLLKFTPSSPSFSSNENKQNIPLGWNSLEPSTIKVGDEIECWSQDFSRNRVVIYPWRHMSSAAMVLFIVGSILTFLDVLVLTLFLTYKFCRHNCCRTKKMEERDKALAALDKTLAKARQGVQVGGPSSPREEEEDLSQPPPYSEN